MKIILLSGTNRPGSVTRKIVSVIEELYAKTRAEITVLDLADLPPEIFSPACYAEKPATFSRFIDLIQAADGLHIVTPEYNGGMPGALKYFIDMLPQPKSFAGKPVALTGLAAGAWGAIRPVEHLQALAIYLGAYVFPERVCFPRINALFSEAGELKPDDLATKLLVSQVNGFPAFVEKFG